MVKRSKKTKTHDVETKKRSSQCETLREYLEKQLPVVQKFGKWVGSEKEEEGYKWWRQEGQAWHELEERTKWWWRPRWAVGEEEEEDSCPLFEERERERDVGRPFSLFKELFVCWSLISSYLLLLLLLNIILIGKEGGVRRALLSCEREREREREREKEKEEGRRANHKWANHVAVIKR